MIETGSNYPKQEKLKNFWEEMSDPKNGMGIKIHPSLHYDVPSLNQTTLESYFPHKTESAQKNLDRLVSYINDKKIIEDKFSRLPPEIQNPQREAKKSEFIQKYGDLFTQNYEEKNKLRSIHTTNLCGSLQLLAMYSNQPTIKEFALSTKNQILTIINGPEQDIIVQKNSSSQNLYNNYSLDQKIETLHTVDNLVLNFLNIVSDPK